MNAGATANIGLLDILVSPQPRVLFPAGAAQTEAWRKAAATHWSDTSYWPTQMVEYMPLFYIPAALTLWTGEKCGISPLQTLFLGRLVMLSVFLALGTAALWHAKAGAPLLFAVLTLPTTLNLGASYNQDGLIIASCALAAALLARERAGIGRGWLVGVAALSCVLCAKSPYAPLLGCGLLPLAAPGRWRRAAFVLLAALPPALWLWHITRFGFIDYLHPPYHPGPLWPGPRDIWLTDVQPRYNIAVLRSNPALILILPVRSLLWLWPTVWPLALGMVGLDHGLLAPWEYPCLVAALLTAALGAVDTAPEGWRPADAGFAAAAIFAAFLGMELSLYITYDTAGVANIIGVESRYYLPLLPFFIFLLPALGLLPGGAALGRVARGWFCLPAAVLALVNVFALPAFIFHLYRVAGP